MGGAAIGAVVGGTMGAAAGYASSKAKKKAENAAAWERNSVRNQMRTAYDEAQKGWKDYAPELQQGYDSLNKFANLLGQSGGAYSKYLDGAAANSLGLGYQKATESIAPQLEGETYNLIKSTRDELIPAARSAAIDADAYGGARDMLTRERVQENLENQIVAQAAADIANQRAQTATLLGADANSVANYLNTGTAQGNLLTNTAQQQHETDMAKANYLWNLALQYGQVMGAYNIGIKSSEVPWVSGLQGGIQGIGAGMKLGGMLG